MELVTTLSLSVKVLIWAALIVVALWAVSGSPRQARLLVSLELVLLALILCNACLRELLTPPERLHLIWLWSRLYVSGLVIGLLMLWLSVKELKVAYSQD